MNHPIRRKNDPVPLNVIDDEDPNTLTLSEIRELKSLARMSKLARLIVMSIAAALTYVGADKLFEIWRKWHG